MKTETMLHEGIESGFEKMKRMEDGSESKKVEVECVTKLIDREIEIKKAKDEKIAKIIQNTLSALGIILPLGVTTWGTVYTFRMEDDGLSPTTSMGRGFINRLFPRK